MRSFSTSRYGSILSVYTSADLTCPQRMNQDAFLKRHRLTSPASPDASKEAQVVFKIASKLRPEVDAFLLAYSSCSSSM